MPRTQGSLWLWEWCGSGTFSSAGSLGYIILFLVHITLAPSGRKPWGSVSKEQREEGREEPRLRRDLTNSMEVSLSKNLDH